MPFKKKLIITASVIGVLLIILNVLFRSTSYDVESYISPSAEKISYDDVKDYLKKIDFSRIKESGYLTSGKTVNKHTIRFFKYIQNMFRDKSYDEHIAAVKEYFMSVMDPEDAKELIGYYKKFLEYENEAASLISSTGKLETADDYLQLLSKIKKMQIRYFGIDDAETLFGAEIKAQEYPVRRGAVIYDKNLYGKDKEAQIAELNRDMWGDQATEIENSRKPYIKYQDKLSIYDKDLQEMDEASRSEKIREFREGIFPPDVVERLDKVDKILAAESEQNRTYKSGFEKITGDTSLNETEKQQKIIELQNSIYGDQAESIRQIEDIEKGKRELLDEYSK